MTIKIDDSYVNWVRAVSGIEGILTQDGFQKHVNDILIAQMNTIKEYFPALEPEVGVPSDVS